MQDERLQKCPQCEKMVHKYSLPRHIRAVHFNIKRHNGEKIFSCEKCTKTYYTNDRLQNHIKHIHEGKKYECAICQKKYGDKKKSTA